MNSPALSSTACPRCRKPIPTSDINVEADSSLCRQCGFAFRFSETLDSHRHPFSLDRPPKGIATENGPGYFRITASTRGKRAFLFLSFSLLFWVSAIVVFQQASLVDGFLKPNAIATAILFFLPGCAFGIAAAVYSAGHVVVTLSNGTCAVFLGVRSLGFTRRVVWHEVSSVVESDRYLANNTYRKLIALHFRDSARRPFYFGTLLSEERRLFLITFLRSRLEA